MLRPLNTRTCFTLVMLAVVVIVSSACRVKSVPEELVSGCVSTNHTFRELLDAGTRDYGTQFVLMDDVERDFPQMEFTLTSCFIPEGTKASDIKLSANIVMVQQHVLRARVHDGLDLMIDREPPPGTTNTYRIYRVPLGGQTPWDSGTNGR